MTEEEQAEVCRVIAVSCMWGHGGIAHVIMEGLDRALPQPVPWGDLYQRNQKQVTRAHVGCITEESDLDYWLSRGYWLVNFDADGCSLFNPPPMNGLHKYVSKTLAEKYKHLA